MGGDLFGLGEKFDQYFIHYIDVATKHSGLSEGMLERIASEVSERDRSGGLADDRHKRHKRVHGVAKLASGIEARRAPCCNCLGDARGNPRFVRNFSSSFKKKYPVSSKSHPAFVLKADTVRADVNRHHGDNSNSGFHSLIKIM
jgi:hypothetical protein